MTAARNYEEGGFKPSAQVEKFFFGTRRFLQLFIACIGERRATPRGLVYRRFRRLVKMEAARRRNFYSFGYQRKSYDL